MHIRSLVFRLEDHDKTLVLALGSGLHTHRGRAEFSLEEQVRSRLLRRFHDADCMDSLRRWMCAQGGSEHGLSASSNHELIDSVLAAIHSGRIVARLTPAVGPIGIAAGHAPDDRTRQFLENVEPIRARPRLVSAGPRGLAVARMDRAEKIEELLKRTIPKLPASIRPQFIAMIASVGVARVCEVLAGWAASQFVGVGEIVDILLALALAAGVALTGWGLYTGAKLLLEALSAAVRAQTEAELDAAATTMAEALTTLGVSVISLAMMRGPKGPREVGAAQQGATESSAAEKAVAQRAAAQKAAADRAAEKVAAEKAAAEKAAAEKAATEKAVAEKAGPKAIIVTPKGVAVTPEVLRLQGSSELVGDFRGIRGATVEEIISRAPRTWTLMPQKSGMGIRFVDDQGVERLRLHGPSAAAPAGSNSAEGWTARVHGPNDQFYDNNGNLVGAKDNAGHIPISGNPKAGK